jgi:hypothetical protein
LDDAGEHPATRELFLIIALAACCAEEKTFGNEDDKPPFGPSKKRRDLKRLAIEKSNSLPFRR